MIPTTTKSNSTTVRVSYVERKRKELFVYSLWKSKANGTHGVLIKLCVMNIASSFHWKKLECAVPYRIPNVRFLSSGIKMIRIAAKSVSALVANISTNRRLAVRKDVGGTMCWHTPVVVFLVSTESKNRIVCFGHSVPVPTFIRTLFDNLFPKPFSNRFGVLFGGDFGDLRHMCGFIKHVLSRTYTPWRVKCPF